MDKMAFISLFLMNVHCNNVFIVGDFNANISHNNSLFANLLDHLCRDHNVSLSSRELLPPGGYTCMSEA